MGDNFEYTLILVPDGKKVGIASIQKATDKEGDIVKKDLAEKVEDKKNKGAKKEKKPKEGAKVEGKVEGKVEAKTETQVEVKPEAKVE